MSIRGRNFIITLVVGAIAVTAGAAQAITGAAPGSPIDGLLSGEGEEQPAYVDAYIPDVGEFVDDDYVAPAPPVCVTPYGFVDGQGISCMTDVGLWRILLSDGTAMYSHGGDPRGDADTEGVADLVDTTLAQLEGASAAAQNMPECWADGNYRFRAVYAYQTSAGSSYSTQVATIRTRINETNSHFDLRAHENSWHHELRFRCDYSTKVTVSNAGSVTCTSASDCTFSKIVDKVKTYSWGTDSKTYYVIFWKGAYSYCGQGNVDNDDSDSANNNNNVGPAYSVVDDGCWTVNTILHEMGHNMGAVQHGAPEASGGWHCNDGYDIMCYADGGSTSNYRTTACTSTTPKKWDCNRNTYCDNVVTAGEWLDTHWNPCDAYNRFATKTSF